MILEQTEYTLDSGNLGLEVHKVTVNEREDYYVSLNAVKELTKELNTYKGKGTATCELSDDMDYVLFEIEQAGKTKEYKFLATDLFEEYYSEGYEVDDMEFHHTDMEDYEGAFCYYMGSKTLATGEWYTRSNGYGVEKAFEQFLKNTLEV